MNKVSEMREQCAKIVDQFIGTEQIAAEIRALPLPESVTEPSAYMVNEPLGGHDNWILTIPTLHSNAIPLYEAPPDFEALHKENDGLKEQLETERMRLAGCGVAANMNTADSIKDRITRDNPYWSASYGDVCSLVDREIALRNENEQLKKGIASAQSAIEVLMEYFDTPEANCSCHISPPCHDCVEYGKQREDVDYAKTIDAELCALLKGGAV